MRNHKTKNKNRSTYMYYFADGSKITLRPGENGVTEAYVARLHNQDDEEYDAQRRENYRVPIHYHAYQDDDGNQMENCNNYLADNRNNPEESLVESMDRAERSGNFKDVWEQLLPQQRDLAKKKLQGHSNVNIAKEEGVSETAIRNRLKKIQEKFKNLRK